ncbi:uncharacterized protein LOC110188179 isoform X1 [Drosophila serrata]|uniref:uncharacterized protein LOC110188179 isoform X1 n=1 Tax=Drosophila serrata TaxID=7274 RepID=UPI000A1D202E|nr:uncharacterized protein LOC110188179 isoform X1 [Drosophila serrata]
MLPNSKLKVLFMNVFFILFSAANLNVYHLYADLKSVKVQVDSSTQELWIKEIFIFLIGGLIVVRFLLCFVGVASRVVAIYPILTNSQAELLMPTIIVQAIDNVILNLYEIILAYCSLCYLYPESTAVFVIFLSKMLLKIACSIAVLNIYSDQHNRLASFVSFNEESNSLEPDSVDEVVLANHNLF